MVHWILFLLTVFTTLLAGAIMEGAQILDNPLDLIKGVPFSFTLMFILGTHEFGHYYVARLNNVKVDIFSYLYLVRI